MKIIELDQLKKYFDWKEAILITEQAFLAQSVCDIITPKPLVFDIPQNKWEVCIKTAFSSKLETYTIKQVSYFEKLQSNKLKWTMNVYDSKTWELLLLIKENWRLTSARTACWVAVVDKYFSKKDRVSFWLIWLWWQANFIIEALLNNYSWYKIIYLRNRTKSKIYSFKEKWQYIYKDIEFVICDDLNMIMKKSDTVIISTSSKTPVIYKEMVKLWSTIIAIWSDTENKCEIDANVYKGANIFVDSIESNLLLWDINVWIKKNVLISSDICWEIWKQISIWWLNYKEKNKPTIVKMVWLWLQDTFIWDYIYKKSQ